MSFVRTVIVRTNSFCQLFDRKQFIGLDHGALSMYPFVWWSKQFVLIVSVFYLLLRRPTNICYSHVS